MIQLTDPFKKTSLPSSRRWAVWMFLAFIGLGIAGEVAARFFLKSFDYRNAASGSGPKPVLDEKGFRNPPGIQQADVVLLGGTIFYSRTLPPQALVSDQLKLFSNYSVYNLSGDDLNTAAYLSYLDHAVSLRPKAVILEVQLGEEPARIFQQVYGSSMFNEFRSSDPERAKEIEQRESQEPLASRIGKLRAMMQEVLPVQNSGPEFSPYRFLGRSSALAALAEMTWRRFKPVQYDHSLEIQRALVRIRSGQQGIFEMVPSYGNEWVISSAYRMLMLNRDDVRIADGMRILFDLLQIARKRFESEGIQMWVALIPSREMALGDAYLKSDKSIESTYQKAVWYESQFYRQVMDFLNGQAIPVIDFYKEIPRALSTGQLIFSPLYNRYTPEGTRFIAETIAWALKNTSSLRDSAASGDSWQYFAFKDKRKDKELKVLVGVVTFAGMMILIFTRARKSSRPLAVLGVYLAYILFQCLYLIEFFPITAFQMYSFADYKYVLYDKMVALRDDGTAVTQREDTILPMLVDGRGKRYVDDALKNPEAAHQFAGAYAQGYDKRVRKPGEPGIREVRFQRWKWNFMDDPFDPNKGFMIKEAAGRSMREENHDSA